MKKKNIIIVGNKLNKNLNLSKVIDSFDEVYRCNLAAVNCNNGQEFGSLAMCQHVYDRFVANPRPKSEIMNLYTEYESDYLNEWFDFFQKHKDNFKNIFHLNEYQESSFNNILQEYDCPFRFNHMPTTGYSLIMTHLENSVKDKNIFISNFTVNAEEKRKTAGVTKSRTDMENSSRKWQFGCCHSFEEETQIARWLHKNKKIDASLCLLNDSSEINIDQTGDDLELSSFIINLLKEYK